MGSDAVRRAEASRHTVAGYIKTHSSSETDRRGSVLFLETAGGALKVTRFLGGIVTSGSGVIGSAVHLVLSNRRSKEGGEEEGRGRGGGGEEKERKRKRKQQCRADAKAANDKSSAPLLAHIVNL